MDYKLERFALIVPYYRNPTMLGFQIREWEKYPPEVELVLVDDGSPEPAEAVLREKATPELLKRVKLYRIEDDIPWNRGGARNLGAHVAESPWILHVDIDHVLPAECVQPLLNATISTDSWYKFERYRVGKADDTRLKDEIPNDLEYGKIKPHMDSYLISKRMYWEAGGYDEDYSGSLGGGTPFVRYLATIGLSAIMLGGMHLHVYTRSVAKDASDWALDRSHDRYTEINKQKRKNGHPKGVNPLRFKWKRIRVGYPSVIGEFDTVRKLLEGNSIARFGDGEFKLIEGAAQIREPANRMLGDELKRIIRVNDGLTCLRGIPTMDGRGAKFVNWSKHYERFSRNLNPRAQYYSAFISRPDSAQWIHNVEYAELLSQLWKDKEVVVVSEPTNSMVKVLELQAAKVIKIECPSYETYAVIDELEKAILKTGLKIAFLCCGPAASCLAYRLSKQGVQTIDAGSMGGFVLKLLKTNDKKSS